MSILNENNIYFIGSYIYEKKV